MERLVAAIGAPLVQPSSATTTAAEGWLGKLTARHACHVTSQTLPAQGFHVADETTERDSAVRVVLRRVR